MARVTRGGAGRQAVSLAKDWGTPPKYVEAVKAALGGSIGLDPCSNPWSVVRAERSYSLPEQDGLLLPWDSPTIYVNPPYGVDKARGTSIRHWLARCAEAAAVRGCEVVALVPVAPNTRHWKESVFPYARSICFLGDTRLRFLERGQDVGAGAPMACAMVHWGENARRFAWALEPHGAVLDARRS